MENTFTKLVVNCETGEQAIVPFSAEEIAQLEAEQQKNAEIKAALEAEALAKTEAKASAIAKLAALGLTEDEAKAIVG